MSRWDEARKTFESHPRKWEWGEETFDEWDSNENKIKPFPKKFPDQGHGRKYFISFFGAKNVVENHGKNYLLNNQVIRFGSRIGWIKVMKRTFKGF